MSSRTTVAAGQNTLERDFWLDHLADLPERCTFPYDFTHEGMAMESVDIALSSLVSEKIATTSKRSDFRTHMILVAAVTLLLNKYTGLEDIIVGMPTYHQDLEGQLINTVLATRHIVDRELCFKDFLIQVSRTIYEANEHQNYPMDTLLFKLGLQKSDTRFPLFDVAVLLNSIHDRDYLWNCPLNLLFIFNTSKSGLSLSVTMEYNGNRYEKATIRGFVHCLEYVLEQALNTIDIPLPSIEIVSDKQCHQLLIEFNRNQTDFQLQLTIPQYLHNHALSSGDTVALQYHDLQLTYSHLNREVETLASFLWHHGIKSGQILAICMTRSHLTAITILSIWRLNCAYLPISPTAPRQRIDTILKDSQAPVLANMSQELKLLSPEVCRTRNESLSKSSIPPGKTKSVNFYLPFFRKKTNALPLTETIPENPGAMAYVIYTSGSTGTPKGSIVEHSGMMNHMFAKIKDLHLESSGIIMQNASYTFDISVWQFFTACITGGKTVIYPRSLVMDPRHLMIGSICHAITIMEVVPSYLAVLMQIIDSEHRAPEYSFPFSKTLHYLLVTGEEVHVPLMEKWFRYYPSIKVINAYGPTEASDDITHHIMSNVPQTLRVPIGKPLHNLNVYVVNRYKQLCPVGARGEIWVSGTGVGQGYLNKPKLTATSFIGNPFLSRLNDHQAQHSTIYKTGDMGRWLPDGTLEFFGRKDFQIKIRGFRIEPGEIETHLLMHPDIVEAVVVLKQSTNRAPYLCGYFVASVPALDNKALKHFLLEKLPTHMVPAHLVQLDRMPVTSSGKINHNALPEPLIWGIDDIPFIHTGLLMKVLQNEPATVSLNKNNEYKSHEPQPVPGTRKTLLSELNAPAVPYAHQKTLNQLFEEQAARTPSAIAIQDKNIYISYKQLNLQVLAVAGRLTGKSVSLNTIVAVIADNNLQMISVFLGILKAGGVFLPIGTNYPAKRIETIIKDSKAGFIIHSGIAPVVPQFCHVVAVHQLLPEKNYLQTIPSLSHKTQPVLSFHTAYIYYTSGSTGRPKGIPALHRHVHHAINGLWHAVYCRYPASSNLALLTPCYFDGFIKQTFGTLFYGHSLCIVPTITRLNGHALWEYYNRYAIDISDGSPSLLRLLSMAWPLMEKSAAQPPLVKKLHFILSGDVLPINVVRNFFAIFQSSGANVPAITNLYGPTECCIDSTAYDVTPQNLDDFPAIPIGKPLPNQQISILDSQLQPLPIGEVGQIHISGDGVAQGYLNNPQLTAQQFVNYQSTTIYKTGDLASWLEDGNIRFHGRRDHQVQIMGVRIDPNDIEKALEQYPGLQAAVVVPRQKEGATDKHLCAFIVMDTPMSRLHLEIHLRELLPPFMIPTQWARLEQLPLYANGKIQRKLLQTVEIPSFSPTDYQPPINVTESRLVEIWKHVFSNNSADSNKTENIGVTDNFFQKGGHSLMAVILLAKIHQQLGKKITLAELFERPTIRQLAQLVPTALQAEFSPVPHAEERDYYPLSSAQRRLYFIQQIQKGVAYNLPQAIPMQAVLGRDEPESQQISGIDLQTIQKIFRRLINRHHSLRTFFIMVNDQPVQRISPSSNACPAIENTSVEEFIRPFDLSLAPLLRLAVTTINNQKFLLLDMHHIISDGFSHQLLTREFLALSADMILEPLNLHYTDYCVWSKQLHQGGEWQASGNYWLKKYASGVPVLDLPLDFPRPAVQSFDGSTLLFELDSTQTTRLNEFIINRDSTIYMTMQALLSLFLARISGTGEIPLGTPVSGRGHADLQTMVGMFVNTLVLTNKLDMQQTFSLFLEETQKRTLMDFENQDYPFEELVNHLSPNTPRDVSRNPLFDIMYNFQSNENIQSPFRAAPDIHPEMWHMPISKFDMTWSFAPQDGTIVISIEYCTGLFKEETVKRFSNYFKYLVKTVLDDPDQQMREFQLITTQQKQQILQQWNDTRQDYPAEKTIWQLFSQQAHKTPDKIAVAGYSLRHPSTRAINYLSYRQLKERSSDIVTHLRYLGLAENPIVALWAASSLETVIALLALLQAGGAYMFISPQYPPERIRYMLNDSNTRLLLTTRRRAENISFQINTLYLDETHRLILPPAVDEEVDNGCRAADNVGSSQDAYVAYTSGSTGRPKGVLVQQKNVIRLVKNTDYISFKPQDTILQTADLAFDASTFELWGPLLNGSMLYLSQKETILSTPHLKQAIQKYHITIAWMTSPLFNRLTESDITIFKTLHTLLVGGDVLSPLHIGKVRARFPGIRIVNGYGPTENCTFSTTYTITGEVAENIPIGKPISNSTVLIVNSENQLQPVGIPGELLAGGDGVAHGYLNQPELTAERFIQYQSSVFYSTGDLARWLPDGNIEFLGRLDQQIKINGFRIEIDEIQYQLVNHPQVKEAVVIACVSQTKEKFLASYVVPDANQSRYQKKDHKPATIETTLKEYLSQRLPNYMVPTFIKPLEKLPLTTTGKIDHHALPEAKAGNGNTPAAPRNRVEEQVLEIWSEILPGFVDEAIDINRDFFEIGGTSLNAMQVVSRLMENYEITIDQFFRFPTIAQLASQLKPHRENLLKKLTRARNLLTTPQLQDSQSNAQLMQLEKEFRQYLKRVENETPEDVQQVKQKKHIMLTGVTGYLGIYLAYQLLNNSEADLYLPIRATTTRHAQQRLREKFLYYMGKDFYDDHRHRFVLLPGDLADERLGLDEVKYKQLSQTIDAVIHSAANVKHFGFEEQFQRDNVTVTENLLHFALTGNQVEFHHISTNSVGRGGIEGKEHLLFSEYSFDEGQKNDNVYARSKFEAEKRVRTFQAKGLKAAVYRIGNLTGNLHTGQFQQNITENAFYAVLKSYLLLGKMPVIEGQTEDFSFVDQVARALVLLMTRQAAGNNTFHLENKCPFSMGMVADNLNRDRLRVEPVPAAEFFRFLEDHINEKEKRHYIDRLLLHMEILGGGGSDTQMHFVTQRTDKILDRLGFVWQDVTQEFIQKMVKHCEERGFF